MSKGLLAVKIFHPCMDHLRTELEDRHCIPHPQKKGQYLLSNKIAQLTDRKIEYLPSIDLHATDTEFEIWHHIIVNRGLAANKLCMAIDGSYQLHPCLYTIFKALLTMLVSTASTERSFSILRRFEERYT